MPPEPGRQRGKGVVQGRRPRIGPAGPRSPSRGAGASPATPSHPVSTPRPFAPAVSAALGVAGLGAPAGGDRWRQVTMATRGVRPGPTPSPRVTHLRANQGRRRRRARREAGGRGPKRPAPGGAGRRGRRSGLGGGPPSAARQCISSSARPSSRPPLPGRLPSAQPLADCGCQTVPSPVPAAAQPIGALPRGASGPRRAGRPRRCLHGKENRPGGRSGPSGRGEDPPAPTGSGPALRGRADPGEERARWCVRPAAPWLLGPCVPR